MSRLGSDTRPVQQLPVSVSTKDEIDELSDELADNYMEYFSVNISEQQQKLEDSIEECLTHLEEVCSVLDNYRHSSSEIPDFINEIARKKDSLERLYDQVDALEQYIFETNRLLDHLDSLMKDLESHKRSSGNKIRQIIDLIPRISFSSMPRLSLLNSLSNFMDDNNPNILDESVDSEPSIAPISEILASVKSTETSLIQAKLDLDRRLYGIAAIEESSHNPIPLIESELTTGDGQVDGSWQELL